MTANKSISLFSFIMFIWIIFLATAHAAEPGTYRACSGTQCTSFEAQFYSASDIKHIKPAKFCKVHMLSYDTAKNGERILKPGYLLPADCKKWYNMAENDVWDYRNPEVL